MFTLEELLVDFNPLGLIWFKFYTIKYLALNIGKE